MDKFIKQIEEITNKYDKTAMFIDMDGTVVEYKVFTDEEFKHIDKNFENGEPLTIIIDKLRKISKNPKIDLYILSLARDTEIVEEKHKWLRKNMEFLKEENWIILNKEIGDYTKENRLYIKKEKMEEKLKEYDHLIFLDDDHGILKKAREELKEKINVFHITSAII